MMGHHNTYKCGNCPVCGKVEGAFMGKSVWSPFNGMACSDECGEKAKTALETLYASTAYRAAQERVWEAQELLGLMVFNTMASLKEQSQ